jgi:hypothetical protein
LNEGLNYDLGPGAGRITWLLSSRFAADELEIEWSTDRIGRATFNIVSLPRFEEDTE